MIFTSTSDDVAFTLFLRPTTADKISVPRRVTDQASRTSQSYKSETFNIEWRAYFERESKCTVKKIVSFFHGGTRTIDCCMNHGYSPLSCERGIKSSAPTSGTTLLNK